MDDSATSAERSLNLSDAFEGDFCSGEPDSVASCALYLHQELQVMGLPSVLDRHSHQLDTTRLLNTVHRLMQLHLTHLRSIEELRNSLQRSRSDVKMQVEMQERLKDDLKTSSREMAALQERERQLNNKIKSLSSKLRTEQDEVRRLKASIQYKEAQHSHEMRKREKEYSRLKQKLGQLVSDKSHERRLGLSVLNALQRADGKRRLWNKPGSSEEDMYRAIVSSYEERQKAMLVENGSLRESLAAIQKELVGLLNERQSRRQERKGEEEEGVEKESGEGGKGDSTTAEPEGLSSGHFQMPYNIVRDGIEKTFRDNLQRIREHMEEQSEHIQQLQSANPQVPDEGEGGSDRVETLQHKLSDYRDIIGRQEEMLLSATDSQEDPKATVLSESLLWRERDRLEAEKLALQEEREAMEKERQLIMEAARNLDRERQTFEDDKLAFLKEQFLDSSVFHTTGELDSFYGKLSSTPSKSAALASHDTGQVDLRQDLSLCSDDGSGVLNERQDPTSTQD